VGSVTPSASAAADGIRCCATLKETQTYKPDPHAYALGEKVFGLYSTISKSSMSNTRVPAGVPGRLGSSP
jgi:hypothetical protein